MSGGATFQIADFIILCYYDDSKVLFHTYPVFFFKTRIGLSVFVEYGFVWLGRTRERREETVCWLPPFLSPKLYRTQTNLLSIDLISSANWCSWCRVPQATL